MHPASGIPNVSPTKSKFLAGYYLCAIVALIVLVIVFQMLVPIYIAYYYGRENYGVWVIWLVIAAATHALPLLAVLAWTATEFNQWRTLPGKTKEGGELLIFFVQCLAVMMGQWVWAIIVVTWLDDERPGFIRSVTNISSDWWWTLLPLLAVFVLVGLLAEKLK